MAGGGFDVLLSEEEISDLLYISVGNADSFHHQK